jgi:hypothetical protein
MYYHEKSEILSIITFIFFFALLLTGCGDDNISGPTGNVLDPYIDPDIIREQSFYASFGFCYEHLTDVDVTNRGGPGDVFVNAVRVKANKSYSEVFYMDHE